MSADRTLHTEDLSLRSNFVPRYRQIEAILRDKIWSGELAPGSKLPSEEELTGLFSVSRATIRRALQILEQDRLVQREVGSGTFVNTVIEQLPQGMLAIYPEMLLNPEIFDKIETRRTGTLAARGEVQAALELAYGTEVFFLVRVFLFAGEPVGGEKVYVLPSVGRALAADQMSLPNISAVISDQSGRRIARVERKISAVSADARSSVLFETFTGTPLIAVHRTSYDADARPLEQSHMLFRSDRCQIFLDPKTS